MVFPGDANHHGTLFGGVALAHMDKIAFLAASRHARAPIVTASSDRIDFASPARLGEMIEASASVARVGRSSLEVAVELSAEHPVEGKPRLCTSGRFTMVAVKGPATHLPLPPLGDTQSDPPERGALKMVDMVFPLQTNHYGTLYGGDALKMMGKAAFIAATRHTRAIVVMAASAQVAAQKADRRPCASTTGTRARTDSNGTGTTRWTAPLRRTSRNSNGISGGERRAGQRLSE